MAGDIGELEQLILRNNRDGTYSAKVSTLDSTSKKIAEVDIPILVPKDQDNKPRVNLIHSMEVVSVGQDKGMIRSQEIKFGIEGIDMMVLPDKNRAYGQLMIIDNKPFLDIIEQVSSKFIEEFVGYRDPNFSTEVTLPYFYKVTVDDLRAFVSILSRDYNCPDLSTVYREKAIEYSISEISRFIYDMSKKKEPNL